MKRLAFIVVFLVGSIGIFEWLSQGFVISWEPKLRAYLETTAGHLTKTQVHIDSIELTSLHRVRLLNVRVTEPHDPDHPLFQTGQIELTLSLIDLPRALYHRQPYEAIGLISVKNPWIHLSSDLVKRHPQQEGSSPGSLPPWFTLAWEAGTFQWTESNPSHKTWTLYQSQGTFRILGPQMRFVITGKTQAGQPCQLSVTLLNHFKKVTITQMALESPWFEGSGHGTLVTEQAAGSPTTIFDAELASGRMGTWRYQDAALRLRYANKQWVLEDNSFHVLGGRISAKGVMSPSGSDLAITAENISLASFGKERTIHVPEGNLNVTCTLKGPWNDWQLAGAWWLTGVKWGQASLGDAKGDFEITPQRFQAQAKSDLSHFRLSLAGIQSDTLVEIDQLEIALPSGASFSGEARLSKAKNHIQGTFTASGVNCPADLPFVPFDEHTLSGAFSAQGKLGGTLDAPVLLATLRTDHLILRDQPFGESMANVIWDKSHYEFPLFHLGPGIEGRFAHGQGNLKLKDVALGKWSITQGEGRFAWSPGHLDLFDMALQTKDMALHAQGRSTWETDSHERKHVTLEGKGNLRTLHSVGAWDVPFDVSGHFNTTTTTRDGELHLNAHVLGGALHGAYTFSGTADKPEDQFTGRLDDARWRNIPFSSDLHGSWTSEGLKPLVLKGRFKTGGAFEFSGLLTPDAQANGTLKLDDFNLRPLGESLHFPKPLDGNMKATLTLSGPLERLKWNGHLEGGPLVYAPTSEHPFKLEQMAFDMTLAPLDNDPSIVHLTLTEGQAKTAEELIRFRPGSYVEFAGDKPARLSLGTEVRNLHLGIFTLFGGLDLDGTWQIKPAGFALQTRMQTHSLFINDYELEEGSLRADYYNGILEFSATPNAPKLVTGVADFHHAPQLKFTDFYISGKNDQVLHLSGDIGPSLWDFKMSGRGLDLGTLGELAGFPYPLSGAADVQVHGTGDSRHPYVKGSIDLDRGTVLGLSYRSGSAVFVWQDARITFTKLYLSDPGHYNLEGAGVFPLITKGKTGPQDHSIDFSLRLRDSNLSLLQSFTREVQQAKGPVEGLIQVQGTTEEPRLHGSLRVTDGEILGAHYFRQLRGGSLWLQFNGDTVTIKEFRGRSGKGEFQASGAITLAGWVPASYDVKFDVVSSDGVDVWVPELAIPESPLAKRFKFLTTASRCDVRGHVTLRGPAESPTFAGEGLFSNGHFTFPPSRKNPPNPAILDWFRRIYWDVNLKFQDGAWFENELVQANVAGNLALKGPSSDLQVDGGLDISEGKISYLGLQFDIQQAHYDVRSEKSGGKVINTPYVRGAAESQIQAVDTVSGATGGARLNVNDTITLNIDYAPVDQIKPRLTSAANPTMSQDKLLARVTQTDVENLTPQERTYLYQKQLVSLIDTSLTTPLAQNVLKKTGIADRLHVQHIFDPNAVTGQDLNTPAVTQQQSTAVNILANTKYTIEKDLSNRLSLGYGVRFVPTTVVDAEIQQQKLDLISDVQLSYRWFRNVYLRGDFDLPTSNPSLLPERKVTIEPRWRFGWWGNTNKEKTKK